MWDNDDLLHKHPGKQPRLQLFYESFPLYQFFPWTSLRRDPREAPAKIEVVEDGCMTVLPSAASCLQSAMTNS